MSVKRRFYYLRVSQSSVKKHNEGSWDLHAKQQVWQSRVSRETGADSPRHLVNLTQLMCLYNKIAQIVLGTTM